MTTYADFLLTIVQTLLGRKDRLADKERDLRDRMATFLNAAAETLSNMVRTFREGRRPVEECAYLGVLSRVVTSSWAYEAKDKELIDLDKLQCIIGMADAGPHALLDLMAEKPNSFLVNVHEYMGSIIEKDRWDIFNPPIDPFYGASYKSFNEMREVHRITDENFDEFERELEKIERAAGQLRALSDYLRVS